MAVVFELSDSKQNSAKFKASYWIMFNGKVLTRTLEEMGYLYGPIFLSIRERERFCNSYNMREAPRIFIGKYIIYCLFLQFTCIYGLLSHDSIVACSNRIMLFYVVLPLTL